VRCERIDWNIMAQVTDQGPAFVNTVRKFWLSLKAGYFYLFFQQFFLRVP